MTFQKILEKIKRTVFDLEDWLFEKRYGLDLGGVVPHAELISDRVESVPHATAYYAVWCRNLRKLLREARKTGLLFDNFIDVGSGKGKACFFASREMKCDKIIGIEFSKPIIDVVNANKKHFSDGRISFIQADAAEFILPDSGNLVFLFNPFDNVILDKFLTNNSEHFKNHRSLIAYANDVHGECLAMHGFDTVFRDPVRKISLHLKSDSRA